MHLLFFSKRKKKSKSTEKEKRAGAETDSVDRLCGSYPSKRCHSFANRREMHALPYTMGDTGVARCVCIWGQLATKNRRVPLKWPHYGSFWSKRELSPITPNSGMLIGQKLACDHIPPNRIIHVSEHARQRIPTAPSMLSSLSESIPAVRVQFSFAQRFRLPFFLAPHFRVASAATD